MAELHGADDGFEEIFLAALERWDLWAQWRNELSIDAATFLHAEKIDAQRAPEELLMTLHNLRFAANVRNAGIGRREKMVVDAESIVRRVKEARTKIARRL